MPAAPPPPTDRARSLKTHASAAECRAIEARAERAGMSVSAYLRDAALGRGIRARGASDATVALSALDGALTELVGAIREVLSVSEQAGHERAAAALDRVEAVRGLMIEAAGRL